ncbi:MAG: AAA family ATPase [Oscillospiraceae bacterium]
MSDNSMRQKVIDFLQGEAAKRENGWDSMTQADLGKALGFTSGSVISSYVKGAYQGNITSLEKKLENFFSFSEKQAAFQDKPQQLQAVKPRDYVPTSISENIYQAIEYCRLMKGISILHGDAGVGKTMAARKYVRDNKGFALYLKAREGCINRREVIVAVADALGVKDARNGKERYRLIREKLDKAHKVIIIDEAHRLPARTLEFLRDLAEDDEDGEEIMEGAGIVFIGNTKVVNFIKNVKRDDMEQFRNRMIWDGRYMRKDTTLEDVKLVFPYLAESGMDKELQALWTISSKQVWGLRGAVIIYNNAVNAGDVSYNGIVKACAASNIGLIV